MTEGLDLTLAQKQEQRGRGYSQHHKIAIMVVIVIVKALRIQFSSKATLGSFPNTEKKKTKMKVVEKTKMTQCKVI